ncbi:MAG: hypothetical protein Q4G60_04100 [bacterium]|nr:hypothetical protein [bacterium]
MKIENRLYKDDNTLILNIGEAGGYAKMERRSYMYEEESDEGFRSWVKTEGEL